MDAQDLLDGIFENSPTPLMGFDLARQRPTFISQSCAELVGETPETLMEYGSGLINALLHPEDYDRAMDYISKALSLQAGQRRTAVFRLRHADRTYRSIEFCDSVLKFRPSGRPMLTIVSMRDLTDKVEAEAEAAFHREL